MKAIEQIRAIALLDAAEGWPGCTADAFRALVKESGLTGSEVARLLGFDARQTRRYTGGDSEVPYSVWYALRVKLIEAAEIEAIKATRVDNRRRPSGE